MLKCKCGNTGVLFKKHSKIMKKDYFGVKCVKCGHGVRFLESKREAVKVWNNSIKMYNHAENWIN